MFAFSSFAVPIVGSGQRLESKIKEEYARMTKKQVAAECREELGQNEDCSPEKIEEILTRHGLRLGLIDGVNSVAEQMFQLLCESESRNYRRHVFPTLSFNGLWT